jgi:hypothetical protein
LRKKQVLVLVLSRQPVLLPPPLLPRRPGLL